MQYVQDQTGTRPVVDIVEESGYVLIEYKDVVSRTNYTLLTDLVCDLSVTKNSKKFIVDVRGCPFDYSVADRYINGAYMAQKFGNRIRIAFIVDPKDNRQVVENTARNRGGAGLKVTATLDEAVAWVGA